MGDADSSFISSYATVSLVSLLCFYAKEKTNVASSPHLASRGKRQVGRAHQWHILAVRDVWNRKILPGTFDMV